MSPSPFTTSDDLSTAGATGQTATPGADLLERARQGLHETVDRLSDAASPAIEGFEDTVAEANEALQSGAHEARVTAEQWTESLRQFVRDKPIVAVATALAIGVLVARIAR